MIQTCVYINANICLFLFRSEGDWLHTRGYNDNKHKIHIRKYSFGTKYFLAILVNPISNFANSIITKQKFQKIKTKSKLLVKCIFRHVLKDDYFCGWKHNLRYCAQFNG